MTEHEETHEILGGTISVTYSSSTTSESHGGYLVPEECFDDLVDLCESRRRRRSFFEYQVWTAWWWCLPKWARRYVRPLLALPFLR